MLYNRVHRHTYHRVKNQIVYKRKFVNNNNPNGDPNYDNILTALFISSGFYLLYKR